MKNKIILALVASVLANHTGVIASVKPAKNIVMPTPGNPLTGYMTQSMPTPVATNVAQVNNNNINVVAIAKNANARAAQALLQVKARIMALQQGMEQKINALVRSRPNDIPDAGTFRRSDLVDLAELVVLRCATGRSAGLIPNNQYATFMANYNANCAGQKYLTYSEMNLAVRFGVRYRLHFSGNKPVFPGDPASVPPPAPVAKNRPAAPAGKEPQFDVYGIVAEANQRASMYLNPLKQHVVTLHSYYDQIYSPQSNLVSSNANIPVNLWAAAAEYITINASIGFGDRIPQESMGWYRQALDLNKKGSPLNAQVLRLLLQFVILQRFNNAPLVNGQVADIWPDTPAANNYLNNL